MSRNSSGTYTRPIVTGIIAGDDILASEYNSEIDDISTALTDSVSRSGKGALQANLDAGGFKVTNLGAATANGQAVRYDEFTAANATFALKGANTDITSLNSPALGSATATTQSVSDDSTKVATTAFVQDAAAAAVVAGIGKQVAQVQYLQTGAVATGSTAIPVDDSIPQITEGDQYMSLAITPQNASSTLEIEVVLCGSEAGNTSDLITAALFKDSIANAIAAASTSCVGVHYGPSTITFRHRQSAASTTTQTFTVRAGLNTANTFVFNGGDGTGRKFGGVLASSIKITEWLP